jgi:type III restriction enzyme
MGSNNVLFSATATALEEEEMIKLPIRARIHASWRDAASATIARRAWLEEAAAREVEHLRPVALYQARPRNSEPTVEDIRRFLVEERMIPEAHIVVATGDQRGLDGVDLTDPTVKVRHVITVDALKEGWDCPSAYVLCATQNLSSATAVEQILGRILRMPYAARRASRRLNEAYAEIVEGDFGATARTLRDKLLSMGFTDEEAAVGIASDAPQQDEQGTLFDPRPDPRPVVSFELSAPPVPEIAGRLVQAGATILARGTGVVVAVAGAVSEETADALRAAAPPERRAEVDARLAQHAERVERHRSPADRGASIELPKLGLAFEGEVIDASTDSLWERVEWRLPAAEAVLTEEELSLTRDAGEVVLDVEAGEVVHRLTYGREAPTLGLPEGDPDALRTQIIRYVARECQTEQLTELELDEWIGRAIAALERDRGLTPAALAD